MINDWKPNQWCTAACYGCENTSIETKMFRCSCCPWWLLLCVAGSVEVSRRSPVASWLCAMLYCFGSYILADIMLGSSPVDYFQHNSHILLASAVWWENPQQDVTLLFEGQMDETSNLIFWLMLSCYSYQTSRTVCGQMIFCLPLFGGPHRMYFLAFKGKRNNSLNDQFIQLPKKLFPHISAAVFEGFKYHSKLLLNATYI